MKFEHKKSDNSINRIIFQKSNKDLQIQNSEFETLTSVNKNEFVAKTDTGKDVSFDQSKIQFKHGYATTVCNNL
ncbi:hypothetical protein [Orientia tsutsugamushi]|uniref:Conjugal transfer protein TraA n=2 Tax=Orientia tsutsugamushi TaxID=784 RepID=A0A2R8F502_ORITS|nr:hypothetical protein [Orientia tsutsugamushi]KJV76709.1 putative conjugative transfer protein TraA [Orientia tsutsugamushi str. TA716]SPM46369.1 conjugal transfer protein TraA [Orientia tsutsugamushi]